MFSKKIDLLIRNTKHPPNRPQKLAIFDLPGSPRGVGVGGSLKTSRDILLKDISGYYISIIYMYKYV